MQQIVSFSHYWAWKHMQKAKSTYICINMLLSVTFMIIYGQLLVLSNYSIGDRWCMKSIVIHCKSYWIEFEWNSKSFSILSHHKMDAFLLSFNLLNTDGTSTYGLTNIFLIWSKTFGWSTPRVISYVSFDLTRGENSFIPHVDINLFNKGNLSHETLQLFLSASWSRF